MKILLTSKSPLKIQSVKQCINTNNDYIETITTNGVEQPIGVRGTQDAAMYRLECAKTSDLSTYDIVLSVESGLNVNKEKLTVTDFVVVLLYIPKADKIITRVGGYLTTVSDKDTIEQINSKTSFGSLVHKQNPDIPANNWGEALAGVSRVDQMADVIIDILQVHDLFSACTVYQDFPRPGIKFLDVISLFSDPNMLHILERTTESLILDNTDVILGLDARGFILGGILASYYNIGFVPVRKAGKLPGETYCVSYTKEYGEDMFELQKSVDLTDKNVLVVDDILATGGTAYAAVQLAKLAGAKQVHSLFIDKVMEPNFHFGDYSVIFGAPGRHCTN